MDNANVAEVTSLQSAIYYYLKFDRSPEKNIGLYSLGLHAFSKVWLKLNENYGSSNHLKILISDILQSARNDPKMNSRRITNEKYPTYHDMRYTALGVPNFLPFHCTISHFQDMAHIRIFTLTPMLKF